MRRPANDGLVFWVAKNLIGFIDEVANSLVDFRERMPHLQENKNKENNWTTNNFWIIYR